MDGVEFARAMPRSVVRAREFLEKKFTENISLAELAAVAGCSRWRLSRNFSESVGMTISCYRMQLRLRAARSRLQRGETSIAALAMDLGFSHHSHLTLRFRREFGESPREWRRRAGQKA